VRNQHFTTNSSELERSRPSGLDSFFGGRRRSAADSGPGMWVFFMSKKRSELRLIETFFKWRLDPGGKNVGKKEAYVLGFITC
jgi:hypothetical protein